MRCSVLFVDDEASVHFAVREYLAARGYRVDSARSAAEALSHVARTPYEVVIADLRLTDTWSRDDELEGLSFIEQVRRARPGTRVIVLTACQGELEGEARRRGADCFLQKPQPLDRIAELLASLCGGAP